MFQWADRCDASIVSELVLVRQPFLGRPSDSSRHRGDRAILVPATDVFTASPIAKAETLHGGVSEQELVLKADDWIIRLWLNREGRFPQVEQVLNQFGPISNRVYVDQEDLKFFARHFKRIPGAKREYSPVTLDLNGHVDLTAAGDEHQGPLRMRLGRSVHLGEPVRCSVNRNYLHRAAKLGAKEWRRFEGREPLVCLGEQLTYIVQPIEGLSAPNDSDGFVTVDSQSDR